MIKTIYDMGDDAFTNSFDVSFGAVTVEGLSDLNGLLLRIEDIGIPGFDIEEYDVNYRNRKIRKPSNMISDPKEFTTTIRVDKYWTVYQLLKVWQKSVVNPLTGDVYPDVDGNNSRMDYMIVSPSAPSGDFIQLDGVGEWQMKGVYPRSVPEIPFSYSSGDPLKLSITWSMLELDDSGLFL